MSISTDPAPATEQANDHAEGTPLIPDVELLRVVSRKVATVPNPLTRAALLQLLEENGLPLGSDAFEETYRRANEELATSILKGLRVEPQDGLKVTYDLADPRGPGYGGAIVSVASDDDSSAYASLALVLADAPHVGWVMSVWDTQRDQLPEVRLDDPMSEISRTALIAALQEMGSVVSSIGTNDGSGDTVGE